MTDPNVICPGQMALLPGDAPFHLRAVFTVYWANAMPSTEVLYLHNRPPVLSVSGIAELESDVVKVIAANVPGGSPQRAIYLGYSGVEMTDADVTSAGWRVLSVQPPPLPTPAPTPEPTPAPTPESTPSPAPAPSVPRP